MPGEEKFDLSGFVSTLKGCSQEERRTLVSKELARMREMVVRDPERKFQQQVYVRRLERLSRFLAGEEIQGEMAPSEIRAYALLAEAGVAAPGVAAPGAAERRVSLRVYMKTRAQVRRDSDSATEVLEPLNVARGGIGFQSTASYALDEIVWVKLHFDPKDPEAGVETRSIIVRAAPLRVAGAHSYGVKFLGE